MIDNNMILILNLFKIMPTSFITMLDNIYIPILFTVKTQK